MLDFQKSKGTDLKKYIYTTEPEIHTFRFQKHIP